MRAVEGEQMSVAGEKQTVSGKIPRKHPQGVGVGTVFLGLYVMLEIIRRCRGE